MRDDEQSIVAGVTRGAKTRAGAAPATPPGQRVRGITGRLRPYRDVRAGFEPWRRAALLAWAVREDAWTVH